jgi:hypothetical protein
MPRAPRFADPDNPARVGYTKISQPVGLSPRAVSGAPKFGKSTSAARKKPAVDKIAALPGRKAPAQDVLRGIGSRRHKL